LLTLPVGLCYLGSVWPLPGTHRVSPGASEFRTEGDFLIGGLFNIHEDENPQFYQIPEVLQCSSKPFYGSSYRRFQLMRFSIEEINNSSSLLPGVTLGYNIFDHCSDTQNIPGIFNILSGKDPIDPWATRHGNVTKVTAVVGAFTSPVTRTVAPLFMPSHIPLISYGASSSIFSQKLNYPSFLRTVHPNKDVVDVIVHMLQHFQWQWVAFLHIDNDYGNDGRNVFMKMIQDKDICLAYTKKLDENTNYTTIFKQIQIQNIQVIIVFATERVAENVIEFAIEMNVTNKTWIAVDAWSLNKKIPKLSGIRNIGTVIGVAEPDVTIPGFNKFIRALEIENQPGEFCNQFCNCSDLNRSEIVRAENSFNFPVYAAVHAIAHALHNTLQCGDKKCHKNSTSPHMVLSELKRSNFSLLDHTIEFDRNGDPRFGTFNIIFWNSSGEAEVVGVHKFQPSSHFSVNESKIQWHNSQVPSSVCSSECQPGFRKSLVGIHKCCFKCVICPSSTYINSSEDQYTCLSCDETEWSPEASTACNKRVVEFVPFEDAIAVVIMVGTVCLVGLCLLTSVLFGLNFNTPVVRSAGGPMCFLVLGCLSLSSISVFFFFVKPDVASCILRYFPFLLFFTVCLACFVVRSFQIVSIFKIVTHYPSLHRLWVRYHGQWLVVLTAFILQGTLLLIMYTSAPPQPYSNSLWHKDKTILICELNLKVYSASIALFCFLCFLCFVFSYMGKELPKNYNEAKAITFCLILLILTWIVFATVYILYKGKYIHAVNASAILCSLYSFLTWYFLPKCFIIIFRPEKNTQEYFQGLIKTYNITNN
uniref:G-protein coupled receptors family 3 profile domain-containing protein n=1 Tax=Neogobius melanostomus TaxID=47308 RepID=A0A8C6TCJ5_9GOBI